ncbi:MAG: beta-glucosidase [Cyclobacteriaceae bacterium]
MKYSNLVLCVCLLFACSQLTEEKVMLSDQQLLDTVQFQTIDYFWSNAEFNSGLARERTHLDELEVDQFVVTTGGSGFGIMALIVGVERGFISKEEACHRFEKIISFLETSDTFHGAFPHWLNGQTGKVKPFSPKDNGGDLVETAFLFQGLITLRQYFIHEDYCEFLVDRITDLWKQVEWDWYTKGENVLYWHWSPDYEWEMDFPVGGYNEALIMYVLAAGSTTHPIDPDVYHNGWARKGEIANDTLYLGYETALDHYEHGDHPVGPLFWAHYSYLGLDPRKLSDQYADYWNLNVNHAKIHVAYSQNNPLGFKGYNETVWGLTSSYSINGYHGHRPGDDIGVISPTAALSSFPYTPEESMRLLSYLYNDADSLIGQYGPYDAFSIQHRWYLPRYLAIDQGPIPIMIENHRSGLLWRLFMSAPEVQRGLSRLCFSVD